MFWRNVSRWRGVILVAIAVVATAWLAVSNQLVLYIHPRYITFTVVMAAIAAVFVVGALIARDHEGHDDSAPSLRGRVFASAGLAVAFGLAVAMVALPPATLSSATADQRAINGSSVGANAQDLAAVQADSSAAFATFTVVDWASLLRQTNDLSFFADKPVDVVGFITADPDDPENVFYVSRFVITCCAVDAQPIGIPVYFPNWTASFALDDWVEVTGGFVANPSQSSQQSIAVDPASVVPVEEPNEPYLY